MSVAALYWANSLNLKSGAKKAVLTVLADFATDTQKSYPQMSTFTKQTGMSETAVNAALEDLIAAKIITDTTQRAGEQREIRVFKLNPVVEIVEVSKPRKSREKTPEALLQAEKIYEVYPRGVAKRKSLHLIAQCIQRDGFEVVFDGTKKYHDAWRATGQGKEYLWHSTTFFRNDHYADAPENWGFSKEALAKARGQTIRPEYIPTFGSVDKFFREKESNKNLAATWATNFFTHWNRARWHKAGKPIEWQNEASAYITTQRENAAREFKFSKIISAPSEAGK